MRPTEALSAGIFLSSQISQFNTLPHSLDSVTQHCWLPFFDTAKEKAWVQNRRNKKEVDMHTILLAIVILLLIGALPTWPYSPIIRAVDLGLVLLVAVLLIVTGRRSTTLAIAAAGSEEDTQRNK